MATKSDRAPPAAGSCLLHGASSYAGALQRAGGQAVDTLMRDGDRSAVGVALYASPPYDLQVPALPVSRLSVTLTAAVVSGGLDGDRHQTYQSSRHAFFLTPAGAAAHWRKAAPSRHLNLYFDAEALADSGIATQGLRADDEPLINASLPGLRGLIDDLVAEFEAGAPWSAEAADSLGRLLLIRIARHRARQRPAGNPLTPQLLARLTDFVRANLSERIMVADMAAVTGLNANRFAHAYSQQTGQSPHQFVLAQRLDKALDLLAASRMSVADVAALTGFSSQQHMTTVMRQRLGVTPARVRGGRTALGATGSGAGSAADCR